ncbi:hypothetical protein HMPREF0653_02544 [Prevotella disiens JCM 6334 = ATCC 29426]|uniref:Uncharacterized protein n=1 Tax=Prevotella disiens JCM 6334 = ATCC 29426 TaxID=1235811 RepID=A0ABN0NP04_9BACT|nr:hypothetical protein HMPREF0653_02544 [Prevotella disiens JCM 6334 = ATCC 29426]
MIFSCRGVVYHVPNRKEYIRICFCGTEYELLNFRKNLTPTLACCVRNVVRVVELAKKPRSYAGLLMICQMVCQWFFNKLPTI